MGRGGGLVVPQSGSAVAAAQAVRVVPGLAGVGCGFQDPSSRGWRHADRDQARLQESRSACSAIARNCSDRALIIAAISPRARQLPRHAIISLADIVSSTTSSVIWSAAPFAPATSTAPMAGAAALWRPYMLSHRRPGRFASVCQIAASACHS